MQCPPAAGGTSMAPGEPADPITYFNLSRLFQLPIVAGDTLKILAICDFDFPSSTSVRSSAASFFRITGGAPFVTFFDLE